MTARYLRGRLRDAAEAPASGERTDLVVSFGNAVVEQILSGTLAAAADYNQRQDEWVVVLSGGARLVVDGDEVVLSARDWLFLPSWVPHRLVETQPGTEWLAFHVHPPGP